MNGYPTRSSAHPHTLLRGLVTLTVLTTIAMNALANALPLFGRATGEVSALYPTLITPAGFTFSIWGVIYLGLLSYSVAQFVHPLADDPLPDALAWPLIASGAANVTWLLLWHSLSITWSVIAMLVLLASLVAAYRTARRSRTGAPAELERWAVRAPLSIYLGWVSVATIANVSIALSGAGWDGWGVPAEGWAVAVLLVGAALAAAGLVREGDGVFAGVFVWAYAGIAAGTPDDLVRLTAIVLAGVVATGITVSAVARATASGHD